MGGLSDAIAAQYEDRLKALEKEYEENTVRLIKGEKRFALYMLEHGSALREIVEKTGLPSAVIDMLAAENGLNIPRRDDEPL